MWIWLAVGAGFLMWCFLVAPGQSSHRQRAPFLGRTFAHRGLYQKDQSVPENSLAAFLAAVEAGYGVELDVQLTRDAQVVVFHDDTLLRVCGVDARVDAYSLEELRRLSLCGTNHRIPLFSDVLAVLDGRVPVIVELKAGGAQERLCELTLDLLRGYRGPYCVESFHPRIVRWFRLHAPEILRGQLSEAYRYSRKGLPWYDAFAMSRLLSNVLTRPQFIAYRIGEKCLSARLCERLGAMRICWTARPEHDWRALKHTCDGIIFEYFRPERHYSDDGLPLLADALLAHAVEAKAHSVLADKS